MSRWRGALSVTSFPPIDTAPPERRLPAARGPDEHDELAVGDLEADVVNGDDVAGEHFRDPVEADVGHGGLPAYSI